MQQQQEWTCRQQELGIHDRNWREEISLDPQKKKTKNKKKGRKNPLPRAKNELDDEARGRGKLGNAEN